MTAWPPFPESPLAPDPWNRLQELSSTLTEPQSRWISGYFAGFVAAISRGEGGALPSAPAAAAGRSVTVLYGTETGNSAALAKQLESQLKGAGLNASSADMAKY